MDREIMVDGVNVGGCEVYSKYREGYCGWYIPCEGESCSYKIKWALEQLALKTTEYKELKKEQLEIKKYLGISHKSILERLEELEERRDELLGKNLSYKQALDKIEDLVCNLSIDCVDDENMQKEIVSIIDSVNGGE